VISNPADEGPVSYLPGVKLPCYVLGPPTRDCFRRDQVLEHLEKHLLPSQKEAQRGSTLRSFALCGPGGVGKTTIAKAFIDRHTQDFDAIFWVCSETEGKLSTAFNSIAAELGLLDSVDFGNSVISRNRLLDWLCNPLKHSRGTEETEDLPPSLESMANWLLVFDNADDLAILTEYWPINGVGSLLMTSRDPLAKRHMYSGDGIDLEGFNTENAAAFLQHLAEGKLDVNHDDVVHLADRIQGLPVLLVAITSMMEALGLSVQEFLEYYEERQFQSDIYKLKIEDGDKNEQRSFFDILAFENFDVEALRLLEMLSLLDPDSIPEFLLTPSKDDMDLPDKYPRTEEAYTTARNYLERRSLISRDMDKQELTIHRVIQESVRARMSDNILRDTLQGAINLVTRAWSPTAGRWDYVMDRWSQCGLLFPHIETFRDEFLKCPDDFFGRAERLKVAKLLIEAGWFVFP
jgi:GTPase SAR1 family protein